LAVVDDDTIDEQFDQWSALSESHLFQGRVDALAEGLNTAGQGHHINLLLRLGIELAQWLGQAMVGWGHLLAFACERLVADDFGQVDVQQPLLLPFKLREGFAPSFPAGLQCLGEPRTPLGPLQFMGDERGLGQDATEILPDQRIQRLGGGIAGGAALSLSGPQGIGPTTTEIIVVARMEGASRTRQLTLATTDHPPQQILVGGVVAACQLGVAIQPCLGGLKGLLADDRWHWEAIHSSGGAG
jgi:hypothetical protein